MMFDFPTRSIEIAYHYVLVIKAANGILPGWLQQKQIASVVWAAETILAWSRTAEGRLT